MRHSILMLALLAGACATGASDEPVAADAAPALGRAPGEIIAAAAPEDWRALDPENLLVYELKRGRVVVALSEKLAQGHVAQVKALAREHFYDGLSFYRVIDGFVAQGGDPFEAREIKTAAKTLNAEFDEPLAPEMGFAQIKDVDGYAAKVGFIDSQPVGVSADGATVWRLHCTGAMALGRNDDKDSAGTEFYFPLQPQRYLDRNLTVFGQVVEGMEHLQALRRVSPPETPKDDVGETIISVRVAADLPAAKQPKLEILKSGTPLFAEYVESRRNRPESFFYYRPNHVDVCALTIPVRPTASE
ncbi:MAG: peptidylprolyl isomerase [Parvularculaceae bacterium]